MPQKRNRIAELLLELSKRMEFVIHKGDIRTLILTRQNAVEDDAFWANVLLTSKALKP